jgi:hypothetical protein
MSTNVDNVIPFEQQVQGKTGTGMAATMIWRARKSLA